jgi:hypothetical protein
LVWNHQIKCLSKNGISSVFVVVFKQKSPDIRLVTKTKMDEFLAAFICIPGKSTTARFWTNNRAKVYSVQISSNALGM